MATSLPADLTRRKTPRQARSTVTVDAIFDATIQVLLATGSTKLNTTRVSHRAGVSVGTLYQYFPNKQALLLAVLERHLEMLVSAVEDACRDHQDQMVQVMAEAVAIAYLRAKGEQHEVSRALYLIAIELDASGSIGAATYRAERAIAEMLLTASNRCFPDAPLVARVLLAAISGAVRAFYEQGTPPRTGGDVEQELVSMCRAYLAAAGRTR